MITEQDNKFIHENLNKLEKAGTDGFLPIDLKNRMMERFPLDCWNCPRKIKTKIKNYLDEYRRNISKT